MNEKQQRRFQQQFNLTLTKLENEAERHRGARFYHMRRTNIWVRFVTIVTLVLTLFNVYYISNLYDHFLSIVDNVSSLNSKVVNISSDMISLTDTMQQFDNHLTVMPVIDDSVAAMAEYTVDMNASVADMLHDMETMNDDMDLIYTAIYGVNHNFGDMVQGIRLMSGNVRQMSRPMGFMNRFLP
ncbi:MAG: hypothetical protein Q9O24_10440 [Gammaproteobacteria bacterium]|nr:hypothetical protein [Gammaproteobacteria bacterium]